VVVGVEPADIADLSARVGVEGGLVEDEFDLFAGIGLLDPDAVFDDG